MVDDRSVDGSVTEAQIFWNELTMPFDAFTPVAWLILFLVCLYSAIVNWVIEGAQNSDDFPDSKVRIRLHTRYVLM